jgi:hypothetical protein
MRLAAGLEVSGQKNLFLIPGFELHPFQPVTLSLY